MKVFDRLRTIIMPVSEEDQKSKFVFGQPVPGAKHSLYEEQQQRDRGWLQNCGAWEKLHRSGGW